MRKFFLPGFLFAVFLLAAADQASASDNVIISKVFYDPVDESKSEAIELYNPTGADVDISGWVLKTETSAADATVPANTTLKSGSYYLIADKGWSTVKSSEWPEADHEEAVTLTNSNAGIALKNGASTVDAVGWGTAANIGTGLYEGTPHAGVQQGQVLARKFKNSAYKDTGNNSADFASASPSFRSGGQDTQQNTDHRITVQVVVEGDAISISSPKINLDDDSFKEGVQINPVPKAAKKFEVEAIVEHLKGTDSIKKVKAVLNGTEYVMTSESIDSTSAKYRANVSMNYDNVPGGYNVSIEAEATDGTVVSSNLSFTYTSLTAMEVDSGSLNFSALPGAVSELEGDVNMSSVTKTSLKNIGNTLLDIELLGTNLTNSIGNLSVDTISYTFDSNYSSQLSGSLSATKQKKSVGIGVSQMMPLSFRVSVPSSAKPGSYSGTITLIAVGR